MTTEQLRFLKFVRTKMVFSLRLKAEDQGLKPVPISKEVINNEFFSSHALYQIKRLVEIGELKVTQPLKRSYYYEALKPGTFDLNLLLAKPIPADFVTQTMLNNLKRVSLPEEVESTDYFNLFLKYKENRPDLFFKVDSFSGRVHTPVSSLKSTYRPHLLLDGNETTSIDVTTMQPLLLGRLLSNYIGENEYSNWINSGTDIYLKLQEKAGLETRDAAKKKFFEILFSKPTQELSNLFGASKWINWINQYKTDIETNNPHNKKKPHSNLAWLLQSTEVEIMRKVWTCLVERGICFLTVHDEIIVPLSRYKETEDIMHLILSQEFTFYRISCKNKIISEPTLSTLSTLKPVETTALEENKIISEPTLSTEIPEELPATVNNYSRIRRKYAEKPATAFWNLDFNFLKLPDGPIKLNPWESISDPAAFVNSHLEICRRNNGNRTFLPYYKRLRQLEKLTAE